MEVVCVTGGVVRMTVNGEIRELKAGEGTLVLPFEVHSFETPHSSECFIIVFSPEFIADFQEMITHMVPRIAVCTLTPSVLTMCDEILPLGIDEKAIVRIKAVLYSLASEFFEKCDFVPSKRRQEGKTFVETARYISQNFRSRDISLSATASALGIHPVYLSRTFKAESGIPYTVYVNSIRASWAARLMNDHPEKRVSEIAFEAGFGSIRNFDRAFKTTYGITPTEFLRQHKK
jgi:AraC-like DNA-binding protein